MEKEQILALRVHCCALISGADPRPADFQPSVVASDVEVSCGTNRASTAPVHNGERDLHPTRASVQGMLNPIPRLSNTLEGRTWHVAPDRLVLPCGVEVFSVRDCQWLK